MQTPETRFTLLPVGRHLLSLEFTLAPEVQLVPGGGSQCSKERKDILETGGRGVLFPCPLAPSTLPGLGLFLPFPHHLLNAAQDKAGTLVCPSSGHMKPK
jgi:hypothetical protein